MENLKFALQHMVSLARWQARITLTRALANVSAFSCERQRSQATDKLVSCNALLASPVVRSRRRALCGRHDHSTAQFFAILFELEQLKAQERDALARFGGSDERSRRACAGPRRLMAARSTR